MNLTAKQPFPEWRFLQLTLVIVAWMLVSPSIGTRFGGHIAIHVLLLDLILVTIWASPQWRAAGRVIVALWLVSLLASTFSVLELTPRWGRLERTLDLALMAPVTVACAVGVVAFAFRAERPTIDGIFAMIVVYLLIAIVFAEIYYGLLIWDPAALKLGHDVDQLSARQLRGDLMYFSLVTIATVGYGDILAVSPAARTVATLEAVVGQFYVAVVVATFVSMYTMHALAARAAAHDRKPPAPE